MAVMSDRKDNTYLLPTSTQFETYGSVITSYSIHYTKLYETL